MRNDPPGMTPLRKLIAPPERTVQIVSVISNHEDVAGACPLFRPSFPPPLPPLSLSLYRFPYTKPFFALPFVSPFKNTRVDQCLPTFLHARFSYGWSIGSASWHVTRHVGLRATARSFPAISDRRFFYSRKRIRVAWILILYKLIGNIIFWYSLRSV